MIVLFSDWVAFFHGGGGDYWFLIRQCTHFSKLVCEFELMYREGAHACDVGGMCFVKSSLLHCIRARFSRYPFANVFRRQVCWLHEYVCVDFVFVCFLCFVLFVRSNVLQFVLFRGKVLS